MYICLFSAGWNYQLLIEEFYFAVEELLIFLIFLNSIIS